MSDEIVDGAPSEAQTTFELDARVASGIDPTDLAIDQAFAFMKAVLDNPAILDVLPDDATLSFRAVDIAGHAFQLTAALARGGECWVARPTTYAVAADAPVLDRPDVGDGATGRIGAGIAAEFRAEGNSAPAALDALEAILRAAAADSACGLAEPVHQGAG